MKTIKCLFMCLITGLMMGLSCRLPFEQSNSFKENHPAETDPQTNLPLSNRNESEDSEPSIAIGDHQVPENVLSPDALIYLGAFRLPDDSGGMGWDYSGHGMTYYPDGDTENTDDGFSGSLFVVGHDQQLSVGEISIPEPVISKNLEDLNYAETLQPLSDISGGNITEDLALPRMGLEYLPPMQDQIQGKLHFSIGQHIQEFEPSHGWASLDLSAPDSSGLWVFNGYSNYVTNDYIFEIPLGWSDLHAPGYRLASGRFREGVWGGLGPALFAYAPWEDGNPPSSGSTLEHIQPLLLYGTQQEGMPELLSDPSMQMEGYAESDHWWGGAWLTSSAGNAVIFTGTKALGKSWYGFANGVLWDYACMEDESIDCPEVPDYPYDNRGFWADDFQPVIIFFNPDDLAAVARGEMATYEPQPYGLMDLTPFWFDPETDVERYKRDLVGAAAFDRNNQRLFIIERLADDEKSVIHVFGIEK